MKRGTPHLFALILLAALAVLLVAITWNDPPAAPPLPYHPTPSAPDRGGEPVSALFPLIPDPHPERSALGLSLFHDPRLSRDSSVSCASCHALDRGGADGRPRSIGVGGAVGRLNAPSVFNAALNVAQFWDGRAATLAEQIEGPLHNPAEMAMDWPTLIARLSGIDEYRERFAALYPDGLTPASVTDAIVRYQLTLVTPNAPFDRYLAGDEDAIDQDAREGYERFKSYGCASCHQGANIGGNMFQRFGIMDDYFADWGLIDEVDLGRFNVTGRDEDRHVFKVPSLRNVALTAPYFHDGSVATLEEAVAIMARYQLGRSLSDEDVRLIVAFLNTLTGDRPTGRYAVPQP